MQIENLDHLGLVAGMIDQLGLVELTNEQIEPHCLEHVNAGQVVKSNDPQRYGLSERTARLTDKSCTPSPPTPRPGGEGLRGFG